MQRIGCDKDMFHTFELSTEGIMPPAQFTWPFHYTPHPLSRMAAEQLQRYISSRHDWDDELSHGKMFGVLVVADNDSRMGFLAAFSGNLGGTNSHEYFVPPIYDMLRPDDFFRREEAAISAINRDMDQIECSAEYAAASERCRNAEQRAAQRTAEARRALDEAKHRRDALRSEGADNELLIQQSRYEKAEFRRLKLRLKAETEAAKAELQLFRDKIESRQKERHSRSAALQRRLFAEFRLLNARGEQLDMCSVFDRYAPAHQLLPPAGAGECAAPKLLQYAYRHSLRPIAMAEFWWGDSPKAEVRHQGCYYPACNSKCRPILTFMLDGLDVEADPLKALQPSEPKIIWEDDYITAIDKPCGMLAAEGCTGVASVEAWAAKHYPEAAGPLIVHRLDQATSGIMLIAKDKATHKALQAQFANRTVKKSYTAIIEGRIQQMQGTINLPLKLDYDHRPRQIVAADGREALTHYEVIESNNTTTRIRFYPITGRTHQLRLHAAHGDGLGAPIVGDALYGNAAERLMLHADTLEFTHPVSGRRIRIESAAEF